jgi:hypothetical protein
VSIAMKKIVIIAVAGLGLLAGCAGRPSLFPNSDPALQKTSAEFAADAAKRQPYKADAPRGGEAMGRAEYDLTFGHLQILNTSEEDWDNIEVWVNQKYVCAIPKIEKGKERVKTFTFQMLYDADGHYFWTNGGKNPVQQVEMYRNGKMYTIPTFMAE